ncbi:unnamed protein product [Coffea canephora]|uniref:Uncharacterized protein n=1 Tax=Coffea canephora TaxID=49390 RepID=A0A068V4G2_COFCA|nr:unnamed protein product [Coffea canephora]
MLCGWFMHPVIIFSLSFCCFSYKEFGCRSDACFFVLLGFSLLLAALVAGYFLPPSWSFHILRIFPNMHGFFRIFMLSLVFLLRTLFKLALPFLLATFLYCRWCSCMSSSFDCLISYINSRVSWSSDSSLEIRNCSTNSYPLQSPESRRPPHPFVSPFPFLNQSIFFLCFFAPLFFFSTQVKSLLSISLFFVCLSSPLLSPF